MRKRKFIAVILILISVFALLCWGERSRKPALVWKVVNVRPNQYYFAVDRMQACWCVDIDVSNMTSDEIIVDWHRDESVFDVGGQWKDLGIGALMPSLGPNESKTFPVFVPKQAQGLRLLMHYEQGPLWSTVDQFFRDHNVDLPDWLFTLNMDLDQRLPGHFKRLVIEVKLPP